ncbi:glycosyltransferase [Phycisphaeraceae bacterium D3-23]
MNVLHIIPSIDPLDGGPSSAVVGLAQAQHRAGLGVTVITGARPGTDLRLIDRLRAGGVGVTTLKDPGGLFNCPTPMREALRTRIAEADIAHIHALWEPLLHYAAREARRQDRPYLVRPCGMLTDWSMSQKKWKKRLYYRARLARILSGAAALHYTAERERELSQARALGCRGVVAPNGIDTASFADLPSRGGFRGRHPQLDGARILLFVGRMHPVKGLDLLITAFARARPANTALVLVGSGEAAYVDRLKRLATKSGMSSHILFTGMLHSEEKLQAYIDADLFVLPSHHENFGLVVVESLACGTPVLLSDQVAICREIESAGVGHVVSLGDPKDLRDAIVHSANAAPADDGLRSRCRGFVAGRFSWDTIANDWCQTYQEITGSAVTIMR